MVDHTARMHLLVEQVIAIKGDLDALDESGPPVRARPPASLERLVQARRSFEARGVPMPRDHERVLRAHDGIDHLWRTPSGSLSLFGHDDLMVPKVVPIAPEARGGVVVAASDAGDAVCLVPGATDLPAVVSVDPRGRVIARFPSVTMWFEWILRTSTEERDERTTIGRRRWPSSTNPPF